MICLNEEVLPTTVFTIGTICERLLTNLVLYINRQYGYYDLFLIHPQGEIFYTVAPEADYGTNILSGKYANSRLGELVQNVLQTQTYGMSDFAPYAPSNNEPAAFIAKPLLDHNGTVELVIALQLSDKAITQIMHERAGMGATGETYLVGSDKLMRSNSYHDPENHSIICSFANPTQNAIKTEASSAVLENGKTGTQVINDYRDVSVLSAYTPLKVGDTTWAVIAEIDADEAFQPITKLEREFGLIAIFIGIITLLLVIYYTKLFTRPLLQVNSHLKIIAQGKMVENDIEYQAKDEIGELVKSAQLLKEGIENTIVQANAIAAGDYSNDVKRLSDQDQLGQALIEMVRRLREITAISQTIAAGDYSRHIESKGEHDVLGQALNQMTQQLQKVTDDNQQSDWLKTGQTQLNDLMSGEQDIVTMAKKIVSFLTTYVEAEVGLFYLLKES
jgi:methyl-accepting chemotaxis protein